MCMGRTHVLMTGVMATVAAQPLANHFLDRSMTPGEVVSLGAVTAGYGVLPDLDHPAATLARVLGPVTKTVASVVGTLAGGHRKGTHTVWFATGVVFLFGWLFTQDFGWHPEAVTIFVGLYLVAMILRLGPKPRTGPAELTYAGVAAVGTASIIYFLPDPWWLPWAVGLGVVGHLVGDALTTEKIRPFFPLWNVKVGLAVLGDTDSVREKWFARLLIPAWLLAAWFAVSGTL